MSPALRLVQAPQRWDDFADRGALAALVDAVQMGPPYFDPPEHTDSAAWLPEVFAASNARTLAYGEASQEGAEDGPPLLGFFLTQPLESYDTLDHPREALCPDPETCVYIAEVGVSDAARGRGVGSRMLEATIERLRRRARSFLLRTLIEDHATGAPNPAIGFYARHGFGIVRDASGAPLVQHYNNRRRLFMRREFGGS